MSSVCGLRALPWTARTDGGGGTTWGGGNIRSCVIISQFWVSTWACAGIHTGPEPWSSGGRLGKSSVNKLLCVRTGLRTREEIELLLWCPELQPKQGKKQGGDLCYSRAPAQSQPCWSEEEPFPGLSSPLIPCCTSQQQFASPAGSNAVLAVKLLLEGHNSATSLSH